jgi:D-lactate dehydrogenase
MRTSVFSTKPYDREFLTVANAQAGHELRFLESRLSAETAALASGSPAVCVFVNDIADRHALEVLSEGGTTMLALRSAGFNHVDLDAAADLGMTVSRVPAYSPFAVAEFTVGMILSLVRRYHKAYARTREGNFALDGLMGFDLHDRTVGIVGTGKIGQTVARIMQGFGCELLAFDPYPNDEVRSMGVSYVPFEELAARSHIITLHCPLTPETHHIINAESIDLMLSGVMIVNTSRGALIDTEAVVEALKHKKVGYVGMDVYEEEGDLFFEDLSEQVIQDDVFSRLLTFPNVLITGHQAFFTRNAMEQIAVTTITNLTAFEAGGRSGNELDVAATRG